MSDDAAEVHDEPAPAPAPAPAPVPPADDLAALAERVKRVEAVIAHFLPATF